MSTSSQTSTTWPCPKHPFGHDWTTDPLRCTGCGTTRNAAEAITSLVASVRGRDEKTARRLLDELEQQAAAATEYRVPAPDGPALYVRRAPGGTGWAVFEPRGNRGRRAWTRDGWQVLAILTGSDLYCWPDATTALAEARKAVAAESGTAAPNAEAPVKSRCGAAAPMGSLWPDCYLPTHGSERQHETVSGYRWAAEAGESR